MTILKVSASSSLEPQLQPKQHHRHRHHRNHRHHNKDQDSVKNDDENIIIDNYSECNADYKNDMNNYKEDIMVFKDKKDVENITDRYFFYVLYKK